MGKNELNIDWSGFFRSWADAEQNFSDQEPITSPIGSCAQGTPVQRDIAKIFKKPSPSQKQEIETLIRQEHYQQAIDKIIEYYGINTANVQPHNGKIIFFDKDRHGYQEGESVGHAGTNYNREITVGPGIFTDQYDTVKIGDKEGYRSVDYAVLCLLHEVTHANQIKVGGPAFSGSQKHMLYEGMAYDMMLAYDKTELFDLTPAERENILKRRDSFLDALRPDNRKKYEACGEYWKILNISSRSNIG
ncbi:MAG: hypothetical protein SVR94_07420 [Pseudomonadota bacterium]|nr:hypothetical protein [Pseudomonadota bacterium]